MNKRENEEKRRQKTQRGVKRESADLLINATRAAAGGNFWKRNQNNTVLTFPVRTAGGVGRRFFFFTSKPRELRRNTKRNPFRVGECCERACALFEIDNRGVFLNTFLFYQF